MRRNIAADGKDHNGLALNQVRGELGKPLRPTLSIPVFNGEILTIDIAKLAKALQKRFRARIILQAAVNQDADARAALCRLLRMRARRQGWQGTTGRCSGDEFSPQHIEPPSNPGRVDIYHVTQNLMPKLQQE